jgi:hypothetical protein
MPFLYLINKRKKLRGKCPKNDSFRRSSFTRITIHPLALVIRLRPSLSICLTTCFTDRFGLVTTNTTDLFTRKFQTMKTIILSASLALSLLAGASGTKEKNAASYRVIQSFINEFGQVENVKWSNAPEQYD